MRGRGEEKGERGDRCGYSVHATHSKQSTEESKWSDNGELITLVH